MTNEQIYELVCKLHFKTDLSNAEIAKELQKEGVTQYTHQAMSLVVYDDLNIAVSRIIRSEQISHEKAKEFTKNRKIYW